MVASLNAALSLALPLFFIGLAALVFAIRPAGRVNRVAGAFLLLTGASDLMWHLMWYAGTVAEAHSAAYLGHWYTLPLPFLTVLLVHELYPTPTQSRWRRWAVWALLGLTIALTLGFWQDHGFLIERVNHSELGRSGFQPAPAHAFIAMAAWTTQAVAVVASARAAASSARTSAARRQAGIVGLSFLLLAAHTGTSTTLGHIIRLAFGELEPRPNVLLTLVTAICVLAASLYAAPRLLTAFEGRARAWMAMGTGSPYAVALLESVRMAAARLWGLSGPEWWPRWRMGIALASGALLALALVRFGVIAFGDRARKRMHVAANASLLLLLLALPASLAVWLLDGGHVSITVVAFLALVGVTLAPSPVRMVGRAVARFLTPESDTEAAAGERARLYMDALEARAEPGGRVPQPGDPALASFRRELGLTLDDHVRLSALIVAQHPPAKAARRILGRYVVEREIGRGAFGTAYLAYDIGTGKHVVLKRYHSKGVEARALDEARALARVRNPRIVPLLAVERAGDEVFLVLEHVAGGTVHDLLQKEPVLPPDRAIPLIEDVLDGLEALHTAGLSHGDVKPSNLLLDEDGRAVLADLGSSQDLTPPDAEATLTSSPVIGSFSTVAPEVLRGHRRSPRTDVYSAGAVAYRLLTGEDYVRLKGRTPVDLMHVVLHEPPRIPHPRVPESLAPVLLRALEKDPEARYADAGEMRGALADATAPGMRTPPRMPD